MKKFKFVKLNGRTEWFLVVTKNTDFDALTEFYKDTEIGSIMVKPTFKQNYKNTVADFKGDILVRKNGTYMTGTDFTHVIEKDKIEFPS